MPESRPDNRAEGAPTARQLAILEFIASQMQERGFPPSVREIGEAVGLTSTSTVHAHLNTLQRLGLLRRDPSKPRAIEVTLELTVVDDTRATVDPYPFDVSPLAISYPARLLPRQPYPSQDAFLHDYYTAPSLTITYTLQAA